MEGPDDLLLRDQPCGSSLRTDKGVSAMFYGFPECIFD